MDYPFYNIVLPEYVHPMAMVSGSLIATALLSLIPLAWEKSEKVARTDIRRLIGAALLIGVLRKVFIMYGLSMTSPIDGSIIDTIVPLLVLVVSVLLGMDRFTKLKVAGLALGMAGSRRRRTDGHLGRPHPFAPVGQHPDSALRLRYVALHGLVQTADRQIPNHDRPALALLHRRDRRAAVPDCGRSSTPTTPQSRNMRSSRPCSC